MKKNVLKKLVLHKETVRTLEERALAKAAGGSQTSHSEPSCWYCTGSEMHTYCNDSWCVCY